MNNIRLEINGADEILESICDKAIRECFGDNPSEILLDRMWQELAALAYNHHSTDFIIAHEMVKCSRDQGYRVTARGGIGSLFVAFLLGITEVCPINDEGVTEIIPEVFMGKDFRHDPEIALNVAPEVIPDIITMLKCKFGEDSVIGAGVSIVDFNGTTKKGVHPGGIFIVPKGLDISNITELREDARKDGVRLMFTERHYKDVEKHLKKYDIFSKRELELLYDLEDVTDYPINLITTDDCTVSEVMDRVGKEFFQRNEKETLLFDFIQPHSIQDIMRILGFAQASFKEQSSGLTERPHYEELRRYDLFCRDSFMNMLINAGIDVTMSYEIMKMGLCGKGITEEMRIVMLTHDIPSDYIKLCEGINYLYPRSQIAAYALNDWRLAYYYCYFREQYEVLNG